MRKIEAWCSGLETRGTGSGVWKRRTNMTNILSAISRITNMRLDEHSASIAHEPSYPARRSPAPREKSWGCAGSLSSATIGTTLCMGGNKARKLEYLMADALARNADVVMTDGGPQSNHARLTAAAARKVGIERCILFLGGPGSTVSTENLLLDIVLGAEIRFMQDANVRQMEDAMKAEADSLRLQGKEPYIIPIGGSSPIGCLGYVQAMRELAEQIEDKDLLVFVAVGSAGTIAGCTLGLKLFLRERS